MKICEFVSSLRSGGAENFVRQISLCARRAGHEITVLLLWYPDIKNAYEQNAIHELEKDGIRVVSLNLFSGLFHSLRLVIKALCFFSLNHFDVVHSHGTREDILAVFCRFLLFKRYRCISTLHSSRLVRTGLQAKIRIFLHRHYFVSVFCGKQAFTANHSLFTKSVFIPNGVPILPASEKSSVPPEIQSLIAACTVLVSVGRLENPKCHIKQIEAMEYVVKELPQVVLLICGKGSLLASLQKAIVEKHLENHVFLLGERSDVPAILDCTDYFISSSVYEGLPIAVLEALSHFKPSLLSPIPPHKELQEKIQGCLCARDESSKALADLIVDSVKNHFGRGISPDVYISEMSEFSIETCWKKYYKLYQNESLL